MKGGILFSHLSVLKKMKQRRHGKTAGIILILEIDNKYKSDMGRKNVNMYKNWV